MIGGVGEKRIVPRVAKYGGACNRYALERSRVKSAKLAVLRRQCEACGRPFDAIERAALASNRFGKTE